MIERVRSVYLRDEWKYDKWGAQGKILAVQEVLRREGVVMERGKLEKYTNMAFPRTFSCQHIPEKPDEIPEPSLLREARASIVRLFRAHQLSPARAESLALEETAERFCLDSKFLAAYLK
jgi:hypothetical protein